MNFIKKSLITASLAIATFAFSQTSWKQQSDFHSVMSKTFHPAEEGNLQPIKTRSAELVEKAVAWKNSEIPADVKDKARVKQTLKKLVKDSKKLNRDIKKGVSDTELQTELSALHDTFHTIVGLCQAKGHDEHEH